MGGTTTNNGNQQVSIYPYQQLSSVLGNEVSYGMYTPGVYSAGITIVDNGTSVNFIIKAGTTLIFQRTAVDPLSSIVTDVILGKVVLGSDATIPFLKSTLWSATYATTLYLVADWTYSLSSPSLLYASFSFSTDVNVATNIRAFDGTSSHVLVVATILNNNYYVTNFPLASPSTTDMTKYHISYESQPNRDALKKQYASNNLYRIDFDPNGRGVYVNAGHTMAGNNILITNPQFGNAGNTYSQPEMTLPFNLQGSFAGTYGEGHWFPLKNGTGVILPATGLVNYYPVPAQISLVNGSYVTYGLQNNNPINITGTETAYYQIDFLRIKMDEVLHTQVIGWESFLQIAGSLNFTTFPVAGLAYSSATELNLVNKLTYLNQFVFPLTGDGETLLIAIRPRGSAYGINTPGIPTADGATNTLWAESCVSPRDYSIAQLGSAAQHRRFKLPVWNSTDLGVF